jgi:hypothetical protein
VNCTRYTDDFNWNTSAEWDVKKGTWSFDTNNGYIYPTSRTDGYAVLSTKSQFTNGLISGKLLNAGDDAQYIAFRWDGITYSTGTNKSPTNCYVLFWDSNKVRILKIVGNTPTVIILLTGGTFSTTVASQLSVAAIGSTFYLYQDGLLLGTVTDSSYTTGYIAAVSNIQTSNTRWYNIQINALETTSTNGVNYTVGGIAHGARYDTQEEVYRTTTSASQLNARLNCNLISPNYASANCQWYYENITDSTSVDVDTVTKTVTITMSASPEAESRSTLVLGSGDIGDTIKFAIRRKDYSGTSYDNQPAVLVDSNLKFTGTLTVTDSVNATDLITSRIRTTLSDSVASTDAITSRLRHTFTDSVNATDLITSRLRTTQSDSVNATDLVLSRLRTTVTDSVGLSDVAYSHLFAYVILHNYLTRTVVQHNQLRG